MSLVSNLRAFSKPVAFPEWHAPGASKGKYDIFRCCKSKFAYNNWTSGDLYAISKVLGTSKCCLLEIDLPYGVFVVLFLKESIKSCVPRICCLAKHERAEDSFLVECSAVKPIVFGDRAGGFESVFDSSKAGPRWDFKCLGISVGFSVEEPVVRRPPMCSFMRKDGNSKGGKKHGKKKCVGLPVSTLWAGNTLFLTVGEYLGLGFGGDIGYASEFIKCVETREADAVVVETALRCAPVHSGAASNAVAIAYLSSLKEEGNETVSIINGPWGNLLEWAFVDAGVPIRRDNHKRLVAESSIDRAYDHPHFVLVDIVETASNGTLSKEVFNTIDLTAVGGSVLEINGDLAGYMRGRINDAVECDGGTGVPADKVPGVGDGGTTPEGWTVLAHSS